MEALDKKQRRRLKELLNKGKGQNPNPNPDSPRHGKAVGGQVVPPQHVNHARFALGVRDDPAHNQQQQQQPTHSRAKNFVAANARAAGLARNADLDDLTAGDEKAKLKLAFGPGARDVRASTAADPHPHLQKQPPQQQGKAANPVTAALKGGGHNSPRRHGKGDAHRGLKSNRQDYRGDGDEGDEGSYHSAYHQQQQQQHQQHQQPHQDHRSPVNQLQNQNHHEQQQQQQQVQYDEVAAGARERAGYLIEYSKKKSAVEKPHHARRGAGGRRLSAGHNDGDNSSNGGYSGYSGRSGGGGEGEYQRMEETSSLPALLSARGNRGGGGNGNGNGVMHVPVGGDKGSSRQSTMSAPTRLREEEDSGGGGRGGVKLPAPVRVSHDYGNNNGQGQGHGQPKGLRKI